MFKSVIAKLYMWFDVQEVFNNFILRISKYAMDFIYYS